MYVKVDFSKFDKIENKIKIVCHLTDLLQSHFRTLKILDSFIYLTVLYDLFCTYVIVTCACKKRTAVHSNESEEC